MKLGSMDQHVAAQNIADFLTISEPIVQRLSELPVRLDIQTNMFICPNIHSNTPITPPTTPQGIGGWGPWGGQGGVILVLEWIFGHMNTCLFAQDNSLRCWTNDFEVVSIPQNQQQ